MPSRFYAAATGMCRPFFGGGSTASTAPWRRRPRGMSRRVVLACLLHDASEAYLSGRAAPLQEKPARVSAIGKSAAGGHYQTYLGSELTAEEAAQVKQIDDDMLWYDLTTLLRDPPARPAPGHEHSVFPTRCAPSRRWSSTIWRCMSSSGCNAASFIRTILFF